MYQSILDGIWTMEKGLLASFMRGSMTWMEYLSVTLLFLHCIDSSGSCKSVLDCTWIDMAVAGAFVSVVGLFGEILKLLKQWQP
jgi:hypothetical protein